MRLIRQVASRPLLLDLSFAVAITLLVLAGSVPASQEQVDSRPLDWLAYVLLTAAGLVLTLRRIWPGLCIAAVFLFTVAYIESGYAYGPIFFYVMIAVYSAAAWRSTRYALIIGAVTTVVYLAWSWSWEWPAGIQDTFRVAAFTTAVWLLLPMAIGMTMRARREADARTHVQERDKQVYQERLRMAQDVHDAVGHSLAVISMNAGAALHVLTKTPDAPPQLAESLRAIRSASGGALDELRAVLATRPAKGLDLLPDLVQATNGNGLVVTLTTTGKPRPLPSTVDSAAYRIVQESLANVVRHAGASRATVTVDYQPSRLELRIADDGIGRGAGTNGSGIDSMKQRAISLAGTVTAGPAPEGGFAVQATLPYQTGMAQ